MKLLVMNATPTMANGPCREIGTVKSREEFAEWLGNIPTWQAICAALRIECRVPQSADYMSYDRPPGIVANGYEPLAPIASKLRGKVAGSCGLENIDPALYGDAIAVGLPWVIGVDDAATFMRGDCRQRTAQIAINDDGTRAAVLWSTMHAKPLLNDEEAEDFVRGDSAAL